MGKATLWTAAQDQRFALAISAQSGCAGAALWRRKSGETLEKMVTRFPYWLSRNAWKFVNNEDDLPVEYQLARISSEAVGREDLLQTACDTFERNFILRALERNDWNVSAASRYLGVPLSTLKHKMGRLEIRELAKRLRRA